MNRAYALLNVKQITEQDDEYVIEGIASTPRPDRMKDVVEPMGARFTVPMPLLWQHKSDKPVGRVEWAKPKKDGIPYVARLPKVKEAGTLRDRIEEAVQSIKYRLVMAVSIGFNAVDDAYEVMKTGGIRFLEWEWLELSLVTIPANADATITSIKNMDDSARDELLDRIKSIDQQHLAALGREGAGDRNRPGASGQQAAAGGSSNPRSPKGTSTMKTLTELRELRTTKAARVTELAESFQQAGYQPSDTETAEFDALTDEIKSIDQDIRIARWHEIQGAAAKSVDGSSSAAGSASRGPTIIVRKTDPEDKFPGQSFTRRLIARAASFASMREGNFVPADVIAKHRWGKTHPHLVEVIRAGVAGGGTGSGEWGAELAQSDERYTGDFITFLYSRTVYDRLPLREVPARINVKGQDGAATGYWVGESKAIPVSKPDFSTVELTPLKVAALAVCSKELIRDSSPAAEMFIRDSIAEASGQRVDTTFLSADAASAGVSPAGILNGVSALAPSDVTEAAVRADMQALAYPFVTAKMASGLMFVMNPAQGLALGSFVNTFSQPSFPGINENGGTFLGRPALTGDNVTPGDIILLRPQDIWKIGDSGLDVSMSDQATIEQDSAPQGAGDTPTAASATLMSLWQTEQIGFKVVRSINFQKRRTGAVQVLSNAEYGGVTS